jgi:transmembrane 9 superfamily protein 2/4
MSKVDAAKLRLHIKYGYHNNWIIDNLPSAAVGSNVVTGEKIKRYSGGFPIGFIARDTKQPYVYNHMNIIVGYHQRDDSFDNTYRVVGFSVEPMSVAHAFQGLFEWDGQSQEGLSKPLATCTPGKHMERSMIEKVQIVKPDTTILYTYDVIGKESDVTWTSRWDVYLSEHHLVPALVHWIYIAYATFVLLGISLAVCCLSRKLKNDIAHHHECVALVDVEGGEVTEETGWRAIHADVFRPPESFHLLYCVFVGNGVQLGFSMLLIICLSALGFVNPARRGSLVNTMLILFSISGILAGYVSSRLYKATDGRNWTLSIVVTALLFPGVVFSTFLFFNAILYHLQSTASVPFSTIMSILALWFLVDIPLVVAGALLGYTQDVMKFPAAVTPVSRPIPPPEILRRPLLGILAGGILPFGAIYAEFFFIMISLWMDQYYYVFGFTLIAFLLLVFLSAGVTILLVYIQVSAENHRWWWFAFFAPGSMALHMFVYSIFWFGVLEAAPIPMTYMLYFGYMALICFGMMLVTGAVGALSSLWFLKRLYLLQRRDS